MRILKPFLFFLLCVLAVTAALSMLMSTSQTVERSISIHAPASMIYQQLSKLSNFNQYAVWSQSDSSIKYTSAGKDQTPGASLSWTGDPEISGEGKIEIVSLEENKKIAHHISFLKPRKANAESLFILNEQNGITTVTWNFKLATPRPWNIFNLFFSLDKKMGKDFEKGLALLKQAMETMNGTTTSTQYNVEQMNFPATTFATIRQQVKFSDLIPFFSEHWPILYQEAKNSNANAGAPSGLIYSWDEKTLQTDIAAALPVTGGQTINSPIVRQVSVPASKAVFVNYSGSYEGMAGAYASLRKYIADNKLKEKAPSIEEYISGPNNEKDTSKWMTRIVFLVEE